ncbi:stress-inducible protein STI1 [Angomonas deanei]|uniref:Tetratricopeptide repeat, putative n=1 Tax=Angomonas deanei TaxID=59799 RepID=S9V772_9TRYP|nr:stress-inducible protein STI1 [Angomonas deanei]EPY41667.1 stress-inducible protein STI1 [Angomonas deanei]CAD2214084.1 Tetratricopeptide repeat, putative [Angomonas deanei]|eukprot:EPY38882.1 stress-inducible protein STI1 [Angomonas deanei]
MDEFKSKGNDAFKAKKYKEAIDWYTKAIEVDPNCEAAGALYSNRAASWQGLNEFEKAAGDAECCIKVRPDWLKGYFRKGVALQSLGRIDEAQKAFQGALKVEPNNAEVMEKLQQINNAIRVRNDKAKPSGCKTAEEAKNIGNSLFGEGKYEDAAQFYSRAIELEKSDTNKDKANYYANRAACYQQTHMYSQMIDDCTKAIAIDPNHVKAYMRRAIAYEGVEKWQLALDDYNKAKALSPSLSNVSNGILRCQRAVRS